MLEEWKPVKGFEEYYAISNFGNVKSVSSNRRYKSDGLRAPRRGEWYDTIMLYVEGKVYGKSIHRLVAEAFIPNPDNLPIVNHIDSNPKNNHFTNLEWCTQSHNVLHAFNTGRRPRGTKPANTKLTDNQVINIYHCRGAVHRLELAKLYGVAESTIRSIWTGRHWNTVVNPSKEVN